MAGFGPRELAELRRATTLTGNPVPGLPLAERVSALLRGPLGPSPAHDLVADAAARSAASGVPFRDVLLATPEIGARLSAAGIGPAQLAAAFDPAGYLGAADEFVTAALSSRRRPLHRSAG